MWVTPSTKKKRAETVSGFFFNPTDCSVEEELATMANLSEDVPTKQIIQNKFKSVSFTIFKK